MINFNCIVQEGVIPEELRDKLVPELTRIGCAVLGETPGNVVVGFTEIPQGFGFRGGELSTTSLVRADIPPGCEQAVRVEFMEQIQDMWRKVTGCTTDELVVSARDRQSVI